MCRDKKESNGDQLLYNRVMVGRCILLNDFIYHLTELLSNYKIVHLFNYINRDRRDVASGIDWPWPFLFAA